MRDHVMVLVNITVLKNFMIKQVLSPMNVCTSVCVCTIDYSVYSYIEKSRANLMS